MLRPDADAADDAGDDDDGAGGGGHVRQDGKGYVAHGQ